MTARLYWFPNSHPSHAVLRMLDLKGIEHRLVHVLPGSQRIHLRLVGFRHGTVPAVKLDGRRVQGTRAIARVLDELEPQPPLFPKDPVARVRVEEAERWGDEVLQSVPRRILRWGLMRRPDLRRWLAEQDGAMPLPALAARLSGPTAWYYARAVGATEEAARRDVESLPSLLDHVDALLADGTLALDPPNAATLQIMSSVRALLGFEDLRGEVEQRPCALVARELFPGYPSALVPPFMG